MFLIRGVDELHCYSHAIARLSYASFNNGRNFKLLRYVTNALFHTLVIHD